MSKYFDGKELTFMTPEVKENGRHMVMTNVQTESKTKYVNIDTRFQEEYNMQHYADVTFKLPQQISNVKSIKVTNVEIPASFYPFSLRRRNTYFKIVNVTTNVGVIIKLDDRFYDKTNIISAMTEQLSIKNLSTQIQVLIHTDDSDTQPHVSYGDTCKVEFRNVSGSNQKYIIYFNVDENGNLDKYNLKSKLGWCLGFREPMYELPVNTVIVSEAIININPFCYLYVSLDDFHSHNPNSFIAPSVQSYMNSNILARVSLDPTTYAFGGLIVASQRCGKLLSDTRTYEGKNDIQKIRIQILDEFGVVVDLNKMDFSFALEILYT